MEEAAHRFHTAIQSKDDNLLIAVVAAFENEQLVEIGNEYAKNYGKALPEAIKEAAFGEFSILLINLLVPRAVFAARTINNAVVGAGTDEHAIIDVIVHTPNSDIVKLKEAYSNLFQRDLAARIKSDVSGNFSKAITCILEGHKKEGAIDVEHEADELYKKGEGKWGTDDDYFVHFFTQHTFEQLYAIDQVYTAKHKHSLEVAVKKETSGSYQDLLVALSIPRPVYWAKRIRHAIAGLGTDDTLLRRAFSLNSKAQLREVEAVYETVNKGKTLRTDVRDDTSGHYRTLFLALLG